MISKNTFPFIKLSYDIDEKAPHFPSGHPLRIIQRTSIEMGDENNISSVEIHSHYGTHVDAPYHFDKNGAKITDFDVNHYYFTKPFVVEIPKEEDEPILEEDLKSFEKSISGGDILLIRTGFSRYRQDHDKYLCNPYMDLSAANYLMDHFPELRGLGIDCISILNRKFRPMGIETHRILLGYYDKKKFLLLFEDVNLDFGDRILTEIIALPLFIKDAEAFPCTVIAR